MSDILLKKIGEAIADLRLDVSVLNDEAGLWAIDGGSAIEEPQDSIGIDGGSA